MREGPLRCVFLGYLWKVARAIARSPAARLLAVGIEPQRARASEARRFCDEAGVPWLDARRARHNPDVDRILGEGVDLLVVGAFGQILPAKLASAPALGTLNVHFSLLPAYRGGWPIEWQILRGERRGGASLHWMTEEVDAGPLALQREVPIGPDDDYAAVYERCHEAAGRLMDDLLGRAPGEWPRAPQPSGEPTLPARTRDGGVIDWSRPADEIRRLVLAEGWRGWVRSELAEGDLVVERAERVSLREGGASAGESREGVPLDEGGGVDGAGLGRTELALPGRAGAAGAGRAGAGRGAAPGEVLAGPPRPVVATGDGALRLLDYRCPADLRPGDVLPSRPSVPSRKS